MTRSILRALVAFAVGGLALVWPGQTPAQDVPFNTMWGYLNCPAEVPPPVAAFPHDTDTFGDLQIATPHLTAIDYSDFPKFCKRSPAAVICAGHSTGRMLTVKQVFDIDASLRMRFVYRSDWATAGVSDRWAGWTVCGDCEDYALTLSELLAHAGQDGRHMKLQLMNVPSNAAHTKWGGHATLWVEASDAGWVEADVTPQGYPKPIDMMLGKRLVTITMDGARKARALPGAVIYPFDYLAVEVAP